MAVSSLVAAAGGKTMFRTTLTSGTSYTDPAGVTYLNVTLVGGGSGGAASGNTDILTQPGNGGTTTFTGATSALGGTAPTGYTTNASVAQISAPGPVPAAETANTGLGGKGNGGTSSSTTTTPPSTQGAGAFGNNGQIISSTLTVTAGASISYAIGAGGSRGIMSSTGTGSVFGGAGGSGRIDIEYWV